MGNEVQTLTGFDGLFIFFLLAGIIERVFEILVFLFKPFLYKRLGDIEQEGKKQILTMITYLLGSFAGIVICIYGQLNIFSVLGIC
jgi:hypothetical protein